MPRAKILYFLLQRSHFGFDVPDRRLVGVQIRPTGLLK